MEEQEIYKSIQYSSPDTNMMYVIDENVSYCQIITKTNLDTLT